MLAQINSLFRNLFQKQRTEQDLDDEIRSHLELLTDQKIKEGMDPGKAARAARVELGGIEHVKEEVRAVHAGVWLETLWQDVRFGSRMLLKNPGFTAVAVLTMALGIGVSTVMFSAVNAVLIRSLPYGDPGHLAYIWVQNRNFPQIPANVMEPVNADFFEIQRQARSFSALTFFEQRKFNLSAQGFAQRIGVALVPANFFSTLGVAPEFGHAIDPYDDQPGHEHVAVISHALWQSEFGGASDILAKSVSLDGRSYQIIGVMPPGFLYPRDLLYAAQPDTQIWLPAALTPQQMADRTIGNLATIGRLRPGVSIQQAQAEASSILASVDDLHPPEIRGFYADIQPFLESVLGEVRPQMLLLFAAASLVLLIACGNTASLLLARAVDRTREISVRAALGAGRSRLLRQMLTEAVLLSCAGGALGVLLARAALPILLRLSPSNIPRLDQTSLDGRVLLFGLGISTLTGLVFGILPATVASRIDLNVLLRSAANNGVAGSSGRLRSALVAAEVALAVVLLSGALLLIRSFLKLQAVTTGFSQATLTMNLALDSHYTLPEQRRAFYGRVVERISKLPGTQAVGASNTLPLSNSEDMNVFMLEGTPGVKGQLVATRAVTEHYFEAMGTPLIEGRSFTAADASDRPLVVIVNQRFAQIYLAGHDPIGKRIRFSDNDKDPWRPVVGVVADVRHSNLEDEPPAQVYLPLDQWNPRDVFVAVQSALPPAVMVPAIRDAVRSVDPALAVSDVHTMDERVSQANSRRRFQTQLLAGFGSAALFLAAIGLYGFLSYSVKQRTVEIGIRLALGAQPRDVVKLVLRQAVVLTFVGMVTGLAAVLSLTRFLSSLLYDVAPTDHFTLMTVSLVLAAVAVLACYLPARRATKVDPMVALRYE